MAAEGSTLTRTERLTASKPVRIARWQVLIPSTATSLATEFAGATRVDTLTGREGTLRVSIVEQRLALRDDRRAPRLAIRRSAEARAVRFPFISPARPRHLAEAGRPAWTLRLEIK